MKSNNIRRRITVMILCAAMTLSYMPASFYAYAQDGEQAASFVLYTPLEAGAISFASDGAVFADVEKYELKMQ